MACDGSASRGGMLARALADHSLLQAENDGQLVTLRHAGPGWASADLRLWVSG
jgi:hypothetical protein